MMRTINKLLTPIQRRLRLMVSRAVIGLVNDSLKTQRLQLTLLEGEVQDGVERFAEYGFTSVPHKSCQAVAVSIGGSRSHLIIIATHDGDSRLKGLAEGEVALYDDLGQKVHLTRDGIVIDGAGKPITLQNFSVANFIAAGGTAKGIVQADCVCAYTGQPHPMVSATVKGSK